MQKRCLPPHSGVDKLKAVCKQALTYHTKDLQAQFKAKANRYMDCQPTLHERQGVVPAPVEFHIVMWPNVSEYVFVPVNLDDESLTEKGMMQTKNKDVMIVKCPRDQTIV